MPEIKTSTNPPQLSDMFQKFALSFKSKAFDFFSDDSSPEPLAAGLNPPVFIPPSSVSDKGKRCSNAQFNQTLISSLFATISSFEASYLQLQTAHVPKFDEEAVKESDKALISNLQTLSEFKQLYKNYYQNPSCNIEFSTGSCLEFQVKENQHKLRALKSVFNRLQSEIDVKDDQVSSFRVKLEDLQNVNSKLSENLSSNEDDSSDVLLTVRAFDSMLRDAYSLLHRFTKVLINLMKKAKWDLDLAANSVYSGVTYLKEGHNRYALLSHVCLRMFQGFDLENFGLFEDGLGGSNGYEKISVKQLQYHVSTNPMEVLRNNPKCDFSKFCEMKLSAFSELDQDEEVISAWRSSGIFYNEFVKMASSVWALHKLAFSFNPPVVFFQVEKGVEFSTIYMEDVTKKYKTPCKTRPKVEFTVLPGFKIRETVIQSRVYLSGMESNV